MKIIPTIQQFKILAKEMKVNLAFKKLGHAQNALAIEYGYNDYNAIKPYLKEEAKYNQFHNGVYRISKNLIIDAYGLLLINSQGKPTSSDRAITLVQQADINKTNIYVKQLKSLKGISTKYSSYVLKDNAEAYLRKHTSYSNNKGNPYVGNGVFIISMLLNGFKMKPRSDYTDMDGYSYSPNAFFNVSATSVQKIEG